MRHNFVHMDQNGWKAGYCNLVLILMCVVMCVASDQRSGKFLALDKLKTRYLDSPLSTFPFLRPLWHAKATPGLNKNSSKDSGQTGILTGTGESSATSIIGTTEIPHSETDTTQHSTTSHGTAPISIESVLQPSLPGMKQGVIVPMIPMMTSPMEEVSGLIPDAAVSAVLYDYSCPPCWCGIANHMDRIVGGWATEVNEYPWVVALLQGDKFFCGGTLIADRYVLTAAHCVKNAKRHRNLTVVLSEHNRATTQETQVETRRVIQVLTYPKYNPQGPKNHDHDIALLKLETPLEAKSAISPVCLPQIGEKYTARTGTVLGWGRISETGNISPELMAIQVPVLSNQACKQFPGLEPKLTGNMMCAGYTEGGKDSCQGDSGGALLMEDIDGRFVIAGIVSWGIGCARPQSPGVYTRVNHYMDWIQENTRDGCFCF